MTTASPRRRALFLTELLTLLPIALVLILILGRLFLDTTYLQQVASQHAHLAAVEETLHAQLLRDARTAVSAEWRDAETLQLRSATCHGPARVTYQFAPNAVRRVEPADEERVYQHRRLTFEWRVDAGPRGQVLVLTQIEKPPARRTTEPARNYTLTILLPPAGAQESSPAEALP